MTEDRFAERLERQRDACVALGSPLYGAMLAEAVREHRARGPVFYFLTKNPEHATMSAPALRLLGAAHFLALMGNAKDLASHLPSCGGDGNAVLAWRAISQMTVHQQAEIGELFAETPQTNEVARSLLLLAGVSAVAENTQMPIRLLEVGASAGLISRMTCYRYEGDGWAWGDATSPLTLRNRSIEGAPRLTEVTVAERVGCDLHPLDVTNQRDRVRLLSFIWPDQGERIARLRAAFEAAAREPMRIDKSDLFGWLAFVGKPQTGMATVLMHSVVTDHFDTETKSRFRGFVSSVGQHATNEAPFAWLRMEQGIAASHFETRLTMWPGGEERLIATSDAHGQDIAWR